MMFSTAPAYRPIPAAAAPPQLPPPDRPPRQGCLLPVIGLILAGMFLVLFTLKLLGVLGEEWSWLWVTSPLWIPAAVAVGLVVLVGIALAAVILVGVAIKALRGTKP